MTLDWTLLLDADMSQTDIWQISGVTDAEILRIEQENPPEIGRFALAQVSPDGAEFLQTNAYPARAESTRINLEYAGFSQKLIAVRYRYAQMAEGAPTWRIKVYGSKSGYRPPINPSAVLLTLDPRIAGAIPLEEKGIAEGVAELDESGIVPLDQLPPWGDLLGANLAATNALAIRIEQISLAELGGEPAGAEQRAKTYTDNLINQLIARIDKLEADYPTSHTHFWGNGNAYNGTSQKSWNKSVASANDFCRNASLGSPALGDTVEFKFALKQGTYTLELTHLKRTTDGIVSIYIDDVLVTTLDAYNSSTTNTNRLLTTISIASTGTHTFKSVVTGKNSSSTGYGFAASAVLIYPGASVPAVNLVLINCGDQSSYTATDGRVWSADQYFSGGVRTDLEAALGTFTVANTQNQRLYKFERAIDSGTFIYSIPIGQPGIFTVKLLFAENYHNAAGLRVGSVSINGQVYLTNFDIFVEAGGKNRALVETWTGVVMSTSTVTIAITNTLINGIELVRTS